MFAIVEIAGRQYKVAPNEVFDVDLLEGEPGAKVTFNKVLLIAESDTNATVGTPYVKGAKVEAKLVDHVQGDKIRVFKFIAKKRHQKTQGHRQQYSRIEILDIKA